MSEPLKNSFGPEIPRAIASTIASVSPKFRADAFVEEALKGYDELALLARGWHIARTLQRYLPTDYAEAIEILLASLGPELDGTDGQGMTPFGYLPHVLFVSEFGLDHFDLSMHALYELTKRFTAEFSIRAFLVRYQERTLAALRSWTSDPNVHVRRLVSEGTRPRLPWVPRLRAFQDDPRPVLRLLELLKDDPELYVRRSVANNLNDIGKDHPDVLAETARSWMKNASAERQWLVTHALRSAIKRGEKGALDVLGYGDPADVTIHEVEITPSAARIGGSVGVWFEIANATSRPQALMIDFRVHFVKANGKPSPKVFKIKAIELAPHTKVRVGKTISLREMTTRKHYPGIHQVDALLNGQIIPLGAFELSEV